MGWVMEKKGLEEERQVDRARLVIPSKKSEPFQPDPLGACSRYALWGLAGSTRQKGWEAVQQRWENSITLSAHQSMSISRLKPPQRARPENQPSHHRAGLSVVIMLCSVDRGSPARVQTPRPTQRFDFNPESNPDLRGGMSNLKLQPHTRGSPTN